MLPVSKYNRLWFAMAALLACGTVFQTSCTQIAATASTDITSSIVNELIGNLVRDWFGLGPSLSFL